MPKDVKLVVEDGRYLLTHAAILSVHSSLLQAALAEDAQLRTGGKLLQLNIPQLSFDKLLGLVKVMYEELPSAAVSAIVGQPSFALAKAANLLGYKEILHLADSTLTSRGILGPATAVDNYIWASLNGTVRLQDESAAYISNNIHRLGCTPAGSGRN